MRKDKADRGEAARKPPLRQRIKWDVVSMVAAAIALYGLSMLFPAKGEKAMLISWEFFKEMVFVLPAVMAVMGLFGVWVERETVVKYLGQGSGVAGLFLSILLGTLPTGPLYVAFPLAGMLLKKGARIANVMLFLFSWACIKLPLELMELQFMGWEFTLTRLLLTVVVLIPTALFAEAVFRRRGWDGGAPARGEDAPDGEAAEAGLAGEGS